MTMRGEAGNAKIIPVIALALMFGAFAVDALAGALGVDPVALVLWVGLFLFVFLNGGMEAVVLLAQKLIKWGLALLLWPVTLVYMGYWAFVKIFNEPPRDPRDVYEASDEGQQDQQTRDRSRKQRQQRDRREQSAQNYHERQKIRAWANALDHLDLDTWNPSADEIDRAHKDKAKKYHPDVSDHENAEQIMKEANKAKEWLHEHDAPERPEEAVA